MERRINGRQVSITPPVRVNKLFAIYFLGALLVSGCDTATIDPFNNDGKYYTVYGFLDQAKNFQANAVQTIRVIPVTRRPELITSPSDPQADLDGRAFLTDMASGQSQELPHSLQEFEPGKWGHVFRFPLFVEPNHTYKLEILRSDGIMSIAETRVPAVSSIRLEQGSITMGADQKAVQNLLLTGVSALWEIDMIYFTGGPGCFGASANFIPYGRAGSATDEGWSFQLNITEDKETLLERFQTTNLFICALGMRAQIMDDQWVFPEGEIDPELQALPQGLSNIENGFGFFGSIGLYQNEWDLSSEMASILNGDG